MTRRIGSLLVWLGDFLRRCFAKSYIVEAQGDSLGMHDFRECGNCGAYQDYLTPKAPKISRCPKCDAIVLIDGEYKYKGKKDRYVLKKTLYSRCSFFAVIFWAIFTVLWVFVLFEHHDFVPQESKWFSVESVFLLFPCGLSFMSWMIFDVISDVKTLRKKISTVSLCFFGIYLAMMAFFAFRFPEMGRNWTFRWENPPTKAEWEAQQDKLAITEFEKLAGVEKLEFALQQRDKHPESHEWGERVYVSFTDASREDFPKTMELRSGHPGIVIPRNDTYVAYGRHLSHLAEHELVHQCNDDPWNLQSFASLSEYSETFAPCKALNQ